MNRETSSETKLNNLNQNTLYNNSIKKYHFDTKSNLNTT